MHTPEPCGDALPADLCRVVDAWASLPAAVKAGIVAMVDATQGAQGKARRLRGAQGQDAAGLLASLP